METTLKRVKEESRGNKDMAGKAKRIRSFPTTDPFPALLIGKNPETASQFSLTESAFKQLCLLLNIPEEYIRRCPPDLRASNLNYWLSTLSEDVKWTLRAKEKIIRGIMPGTKVPLTNVQLMEALAKIPFFAERKIVRDWTFFDDSMMHVRFIFPDSPILFEDEARTKGVMAGIHISFSEIGQIGLRVDFLTFREKSDSTILTMSGGKRFYRPGKIFTNPEELAGAVAAALNSGFPGKVEEFGATIAKAREKQMKDFKNWIDKQRRKYKFPTKLAERATEVFEGQEDKSVWMAINALSRTAREKLDGEKRYSMEALAGNLLDSSK